MEKQFDQAVSSYYIALMNRYERVIRSVARAMYKDWLIGLRLSSQNGRSLASQVLPTAAEKKIRWSDTSE